MRTLLMIPSVGARVVFAVFLFCGAVTAEQLSHLPTPDEIVKALEPSATRSLSSRPSASAAANEDAFIDSLRNKDTRSLSISDRSKLDAIAESKPAIDLTMEFAYNSDVLRGEALQVAHNLGKALTAPQLKNKTFMLGGHTDAKGSDAFNKSLSEKRANAVKHFLVKHYGIKPETLIAVGYGKTHLKNPDAPFSRENRRVQTVNILPVRSQ